MAVLDSYVTRNASVLTPEIDGINQVMSGKQLKTEFEVTFQFLFVSVIELDT
jgi:hypothetical protein